MIEEFLLWVKMNWIKDTCTHPKERFVNFGGVIYCSICYRVIDYETEEIRKFWETNVRK